MTMLPLRHARNLDNGVSFDYLVEIAAAVWMGMRDFAIVVPNVLIPAVLDLIFSVSMIGKCRAQIDSLPVHRSAHRADIAVVARSPNLFYVKAIFLRQVLIIFEASCGKGVDGFIAGDQLCPTTLL